MPIYTIKSTVILILLLLLFNNSCTNKKTVVVSRPDSYSTLPSSQTNRLIPQNDKRQRDYSPDRFNLQRIYLEDLQKGFDHKYESKYEEKDFTQLKFFLRALIELDTIFNEQTDFPVLIQNALFGVVSYAKSRLKQEISHTREELHINQNKVLYRWANERSVDNDLSNIENLEKSLQALKSYDSDMEIKDLIAAGIYAMYKMVRDPYTSSYPAFPEVDLSLNLVDKVLMLDKIGMTIGYEDGLLRVVNLQYGFTAYEAGIKTGDQIIKINDVPIESLSLQQIEKLFDGKINLLTVTRNIKGGQHQTSFIVPNQLMYNYFNPNPTTRYCLLENGIGYIRMGKFGNVDNNNLFREDYPKYNLIEDALKFFKQSPPKALILDLRNNPGGREPEAIASNFLHAGQVVYEYITKNQPPKKNFILSNITTVEYPLVVLINERSASASEVLAGALKHYRRAILIGTNSFGKGTAWTDIQSPDYTTWLMINCSQWLTPSRESIDKVGIAPHISFEGESIENPNFSKYLHEFYEIGIDADVAQVLMQTSFKIIAPEIIQKNKSLHCRLGDEYMKMNEYRLAEREYNKALKITCSDSYALVGLGNLCRHYGSHNLANAYYEKAIQISSHNLAGYYNRGINQLILGEHNKAIEDFRMVLSLNQFYPGANYYLGLALKKVNRENDAIGFFEKAHVFDTSILRNSN